MPDWLVELFSRYGYGVVFVGVLLENTGIPIPGETMLLAGAALAHGGRLSLRWVVVTAIAGAILGDNFGFLIGRHGGRALAARHGPRIGLTAGRLHQFDRFFDRYGAAAIFFARFVTGLRVFGALIAGASGFAWRSFLVYNACGAIVWSLAIGLVGYSLAYSFEALERWVGRSGLMALAIVAIAVVVVYRRSGPAFES